MGGAARYRAEVYRYLARTGREDVKLIGADRRLDSAWLLQRETAKPLRARRVALNNVSFLSPGGDRWTIVANSWHFATDQERETLTADARGAIGRRAAVVRLAVRRSDVIIAPCTDMAERIIRVLPSVQPRVVVRMHPVSTYEVPDKPRDQIILCPVIFSHYKRMATRIMDLLSAVDHHIEPSVRIMVTAERCELPESLSNHPRVKLVGRLAVNDLRPLWESSRAIYFPTSMEAFGYPLAEARANGVPVIALESSQNREIAGPALCGFAEGNLGSLREATEIALKKEVKPDPTPFNPEAYFNWLLGPSR
jgi:hypothetical protein